METTFTTDYFAPVGRYSRFRELAEIDRGSSDANPMPAVATGPELEPADHMTYIIMGLAILAAVIVPLLNLS